MASLSCMAAVAKRGDRAAEQTEMAATQRGLPGALPASARRRRWALNTCSATLALVMRPRARRDTQATRTAEAGSGGAVPVLPPTPPPSVAARNAATAEVELVQVRSAVTSA